MIPGKLIVDLFAGGGGMSVAFERAFGRRLVGLPIRGYCNAGRVSTNGIISNAA
jgi:hypothetical protein